MTPVCLLLCLEQLTFRSDWERERGGFVMSPGFSPSWRMSEGVCDLQPLCVIRKKETQFFPYSPKKTLGGQKGIFSRQTLFLCMTISLLKSLTHFSFLLRVYIMAFSCADRLQEILPFESLGLEALHFIHTLAKWDGRKIVLCHVGNRYKKGIHISRKQ